MREEAFTIEYDCGLTEEEVREQLERAFNEGQLTAGRREGALTDKTNVLWLEDCDDYEVSSVREADTLHDFDGKWASDGKKRYTVTVMWFEGDSQ